ncbi:MAG: glycosyltransferase [Anaerolineales bacterium]|nr:glycosyltransferase [Anaerolineales bacterium]
MINAYRILFRRKYFDWSFLPLVRWSISAALYFKFILTRRASRFQAIQSLLKAHRVLLTPYFDTPAPMLQPIIESTIQREFFQDGQVQPELTESCVLADRELRLLKERGLVLKKPRRVGGQVVERGVLLLKATNTFGFFRCCVDVTAVLQDYTLVLEPSWSGYADYNLLYFTRFIDHPIVVMATEKRDYEFVQKLGSNLIPVNFGAGDWVDPEVFRPLADQEKLYDAVMVAGWAMYKRHYVLFRALHEMKDSSFQVALLGLTWAGGRSEIEQLIDFYGIRKNVTLFEELPAEQVNQMLNKSKVNLLLSLQEGSNRSLFEGFFAGVPGLTLRNNVGIQKEYFTSQTGRLIDEKELTTALRFFRQHWVDFNPRPWAEANIAPQVTTAKLNQIIKDLALQRGEEWTTDMVAKCNRRNMFYFPEGAGRGMPSMSEILQQYAYFQTRDEFQTQV